MAVLISPEQRLLTAADLDALPSELPSGSVRYELWAGRLKIMSPMTEEHGAIVSTIAALLRRLGQEPGHGRARAGDVAVIVARDPDTVVGADVVFLTRDQLPAKRSREGYLATVPALIVEVRSKNDTAAELTEKVRAYLRAGARVVWVADPRAHSVSVYRSGEDPLLLKEGDRLNAEGIFPGLDCVVADLFEEID